MHGPQKHLLASAALRLPPRPASAASAPATPARLPALQASQLPSAGTGSGSALYPFSSYRPALPHCRKVHKIARPMQSPASSNNLPDLLQMRVGVSARMSYDPLLHDSALADWCVDSDDFAR